MEELKFKIVFVGDSTVGKTSIIRRFLKLEMDTTSTLGATSSKVETVIEGQKIVMNVWDTAGQDTFRNLVPIYAKNSNAAVIVFDQTNVTTWENVNKWYDYLINTVGQISTILVANKSDMECKIDLNAVYLWASEHNIDIIRTSAKEGTNIETLFDNISQLLYKQHLDSLEKGSPKTEEKQQEEAEPAPQTVQLSEEPEKKQQKKSCCN